LHELLLLVCDQVVDKVQDPDETYRGQVALRRDVHQKVHDLVIKFDLGHGLEELLFSLFVHPLVVKEVLGDTLEEVERVVVVALAWAPIIDAVDEAHISFLWQFDVNKVLNQLESVWLRELLQDESSLLLILVEHL
jgi:hypothetical protein